MTGETVDFGVINWLVVAGFLLFTTILGERLKTKGDSLDSFFKGGQSMPWWAVSGSLIATKTSASTFIAVPAFIFAAGGDLTYLQATIGFALGVMIMLFVLLKEYYESDVFGPYEFFEQRLGISVGNLTRLIYIIGTLLAQSVRLLVTAVVLSVVSGMDTALCVAIIVTFSVVWSMIGGISTVIWTDAILYAVFTIGAIISLLYAVGAVPGGLAQVFEIADESAKLTLIDLSTDPTKITLWAALIGVTFFEFASTAVDQTVTQRALTCKNLSEARKAVGFSAVSVLTTWLMAGVALAIFAYYQLNPLDPGTAIEMAAEPDRIFPYFVIDQLPVGISGLIVAAIFAAGISTLDSALTALSEVSVVGLGRRYIPKLKGVSESVLIGWARRMIAVWGIAIGLLAIAAIPLQDQGLLALGFKASGFVYGSLIAIAFLSLMRRGNFVSILIGTVLGTLSVILLDQAGINFFWWYPVGASVTFFSALLIDFAQRLLPNSPNTRS
ncbi:MAG: sodium:solute symporter [Henriciella sp.]